MIRSFADKRTELVWQRRHAKLPRDVARQAWKKLAMLDQAVTLDDVRVPPVNRLEALRGDRAGQHSIRINDQYRLCFVWTDHGPTRVEIVDYH